MSKRSGVSISLYIETIWYSVTGTVGGTIRRGCGCIIGKIRKLFSLQHPHRVILSLLTSITLTDVHTPWAIKKVPLLFLR